MEELKQQQSSKEQGGADATLDELVLLAEKAARAIERLHAENARLVREMEALQTDANRYRWLRTRFGNSIFFSDIEAAYLQDHPEERDRDQVDAKLSGDPQ